MIDLKAVYSLFYVCLHNEGDSKSRASCIYGTSCLRRVGAVSAGQSKGRMRIGLMRL